MIVQVLIYTVLSALAALATYAAATPVYKSSRGELESKPGNEEDPTVKAKERPNASTDD